MDTYLSYTDAAVGQKGGKEQPEGTEAKSCGLGGSP